MLCYERSIRLEGFAIHHRGLLHKIPCGKVYPFLFMDLLYLRDRFLQVFQSDSVFSLSCSFNVPCMVLFYFRQQFLGWLVFTFRECKILPSQLPSRRLKWVPYSFYYRHFFHIRIMFISHVRFGGRPGHPIDVLFSRYRVHSTNMLLDASHSPVPVGG